MNNQLCRSCYFLFFNIFLVLLRNKSLPNAIYTHCPLCIAQAFKMYPSVPYRSTADIAITVQHVPTRLHFVLTKFKLFSMASTPHDHQHVRRNDQNTIQNLERKDRWCAPTRGMNVVNAAAKVLEHVANARGALKDRSAAAVLLSKDAFPSPFRRSSLTSFRAITQEKTYLFHHGNTRALNTIFCVNASPAIRMTGGTIARLDFHQRLGTGICIVCFLALSSVRCMECTVPALRFSAVGEQNCSTSLPKQAV